MLCSNDIDYLLVHYSISEYTKSWDINKRKNGPTVLIVIINVERGTLDWFRKRTGAWTPRGTPSAQACYTMEHVSTVLRYIWENVKHAAFVLGYFTPVLVIHFIILCSDTSCEQQTISSDLCRALNHSNNPFLKHIVLHVNVFPYCSARFSFPLI